MLLVIDLRRGTPKLEVAAPRPQRFVDLCQTLVVPLPQQEPQGYTFLAVVEFDGHTLDKIYMKDTDYPRSFVEFAHLLEEPFVLVTRSSRSSFGSPTELRRCFESRWWALGKE